MLNEYVKVCNAMAEACNKQLFDGCRDWDWIGTIGDLCDFDGVDFLSLPEMYLILQNKMTYEDYSEWREYNLDTERHINLKSWIGGLRPCMLKDK